MPRRWRLKKKPYIRWRTTPQRRLFPTRKSSKPSLIRRAVLTDTLRSTHFWFSSSFPKQASLKTLMTGAKIMWKFRKVRKAFPFLNLSSMQRKTVRPAFPTMWKRSLMFRRPTAKDRLHRLSTVTRKHSLPLCWILPRLKWKQQMSFRIPIWRRFITTRNRPCM